MKILFALALNLALSSFCFAADWTWRGFEIIGNRSVDSQTIQTKIPIKVGENYKADLEGWKKYSEVLKDDHGFAYVNISSVRYSNFDAYVVVEVVEKGDEKRIQFRKIGTEKMSFPSVEVFSLYTKLQERLMELFNQGSPPKESFSQDFVDWDDPQMHEICVRLSEIVPSLRESLFKTLREDLDDQNRVAAADLLNYTKGNLEETADRAVALLDDPNANVRNNISRFTLHFPKLIKTEAIRNRMIEAFALQLTRPSHGDRNKAIINLWMLGKEFPESLPAIESKAGVWVRLLAEKSILSNVQGTALDLVKLLDSK